MKLKNFLYDKKREFREEAIEFRLFYLETLRQRFIAKKNKKELESFRVFTREGREKMSVYEREIRNPSLQDLARKVLILRE
jgi:hypothetical protein